MERRKTITVHRDELYRLVWEKPATKLSEELGISGSLLTRICQKLNVPKPKLGYWSKVAHGKKVRVPKLPPLREGERDTWTIDPDYAARERQKAERRKETSQIEVSPEASKILEAGNLEEHEWIRATRAALKGVNTDREGRLEPKWGKRHVSLFVSEDTLERALAFSNRLLHLAEHEGLEIVCEEPKPAQERRCGYQQPETPNRAAKFQWKGQRLEIRILERFRREEKEDAKFWNRYEYHPTGRLECSMIGACGYEGRQSWKDGKIQRIEQFSAQIVSCLKQGAEARERFLIQCAKEEERRKKIEAVRSALWSQQFRERSAVEDLMKEALQLSEAERLRAYADAAETRIREAGQASLEPGSDASLWLQWIRTRADMQDPLRKGAAPWRRVCRRIIRLEE